MAIEIIRVTTYAQALEAMNEKTYTLDGIHGTIKVKAWGGRTKVSHEPSKKGQKTEAYIDLRRQLGDDWSTDLTYSERFGQIAYDLGIRFGDEK